jgi:hypothetical protein
VIESVAVATPNYRDVVRLRAKMREEVGDEEYSRKAPPK